MEVKEVLHLQYIARSCCSVVRIADHFCSEVHLVAENPEVARRNEWEERSYTPHNPPIKIPFQGGECVREDVLPAGGWFSKQTPSHKEGWGFYWLTHS